MESLAALADPTRRHIIETLAGGPRSSGEIASLFSISPPAVSQHLKRLQQAGLVQVRAQAQRRIYELDKDGVDELAQWVTGLQQFWSDRFDALESSLNS